MFLVCSTGPLVEGRRIRADGEGRESSSSCCQGCITGKWGFLVSSRENLSSVCLTRPDMNQPVQSQKARNFGFKKKRDCTICGEKTKALICAVIAQLNCFVSACAKSKSRFSLDTSHILQHA